MYKIIISPNAKKDLGELQKADPSAFRKASKLLEELMLHPYTGTGKPKRLKHNYAGYYSRRISQKHRLVYTVNEGTITVLVVSVSSHYNDK
ncbi:Txe/YoeB family addiction module toxin [Parabacteroides sp. OttesenSCG-928-O15]|nr:Txe/YoeB family addiction module toxin [Parabacteroides sp. OttesenSCG-928-O15]